VSDGTITIKTTALVPGVPYKLEAAPTADGPWATVMTDIAVTAPSLKTIATAASEPFYRLTAP
jgi:hypothetical protein